MAPPQKAKVLASLTEVVGLLERGKAHFVRCRQRGREDMALLPYRHLQPVLHAAIQDFGALVALRYDLLERMLKETKIKMRSVVLNLDRATAKTAKRKPKRASKTKKPKTKRRRAKVAKATKAKAKNLRRSAKAKKRVAKKVKVRTKAKAKRPAR